MQDRHALAPESDELAASRLEGDRDATPLPGSLGRPARISMVAEAVSVPVAWLDRLVSMLQEVPYDQGVRPLALALGPALERIVPDVRAMVRVEGADGAGSAHVDGASLSASSRVSWTEPPKSNERLRPVRVFPEAAYERSVTLSGPVANASLHFAAEEDILRSDASPHVQVQERAAALVSHALARAQAEERVAKARHEMRAADLQMVQVEKLASLGQIAAGMVHELNNPLTAIAAYTDFLLRRIGGRPGADADDLERLRRIAESANRMLRFTRDLVSYARPSGEVPIAVSINDVIDRAVAFCEHEIAGASVAIERTFDPDVGPVRGLPEQLAQVFVNLVTNACHAMSPSDHPSRPAVLRLSTTAAGAPGCPRVTVIVQDSGSGIAPEHLGLVFNPFFTTKAVGRGTGLGLSIVKKIVDGHAGDIRAESDPSYGTRFVLSFPVEARSAGPSDDGGSAPR